MNLNRNLELWNIGLIVVVFFMVILDEDMVSIHKLDKKINVYRLHSLGAVWELM